MTGSSPTAPRPPCAAPYCACGRCYSPGSLVGDWVRTRARRGWRALCSAVLRRPHRFDLDDAGAVRLPAWVTGMWDGDLVSDERS